MQAWTQRKWMRAVLLAGVVATLAAMAPGARADATLDGETVVTDRARITVAPTGLPAQIAITPANDETPLQFRGREDNIEPATLQAMGRGDQLRDPMRLLFEVDGAPVEMRVTRAAEPAAKDGVVTASSEMTGGPLTVKVNTAYMGDGRIAMSINYTGGATVTRAALITPLRGEVDIVVPRGPAAGAEFATITVERAGLVWGNSADDAGGPDRSLPGKLTYVFTGDGNRGLSAFIGEDNGWNIDRAGSAAVLRADDALNLDWELNLVNTATRVGGGRTASLALVVHPATMPEPGDRAAEWFGDAPEAARHGGAPDLSTLTEADRVAARAAADAVAMEPVTEWSLLDARSHGTPQEIDRAYLRYLLGVHTGLKARILPDNEDLTHLGDSPKADRHVVGRALAHGVGADLAGLVQKVEAIRAVNVLEQGGYFNEESEVEFIPYWRSENVVHYGPVWEVDPEFRTTAEDPYKDVYVSAIRVKRGGSGARTAADVFFVIVNDGDENVRQRLFVSGTRDLFGGRRGRNALSNAEARSMIDWSGIPADSDYRPHADVLYRAVPAQSGGHALINAETKGLVVHNTAKGREGEVYGEVFVPAKDFVILYGYGE